MLFNSYVFIFAFLPVVLAGYWLVGRRGGNRLPYGWLAGWSLFFYGWWNPAYLVILMLSIAVNYALGLALAGRGPTVGRKWVLGSGVVFNLALLGYYKYANFLVDSVNAVAGSHLSLDEIVLPLAISFFTFQQISYLVDAYRGEAGEYDFVQYVLFVTFFPQLIAGPIVHHKEMMPQFAGAGSVRAENLAVGLTIFSIGLFKKTLLADNVAAYATPVFDAAETGASIGFADAWTGALAYTFQLYFDFSGYSDMAIGLARLFGIVLPINFYSPYRATSIIEFWRRWHMTLSRFLRDYLYIPLGGNRKGRARRYLNLLATMTLGGLWHGAGWTFVAWGFLHGLMLAVNHGWGRLLASVPAVREHVAYKAVAWLFTFLAVVALWVFFRAETLAGAGVILSGMGNLQGFASEAVIVESSSTYWIAACLLIAVAMPNTQQIFGDHHRAEVPGKPQTARRLAWRASPLWAVVAAFMAVCAIFRLSSVSEFLYFQF